MEQPATIALVDDDYRVGESLENLLASRGYDVVTFASAEQFLGRIRVARIDCLITDICLPAMSGWQLVERVRRLCPELPVILITAREEEWTSSRFSCCGARYLFSKPFDAQQLLQAVERLVDAGHSRT